MMLPPGTDLKITERYVLRDPDCAPQVSVVIPIYNAAAHLRKTLQTVLDQTLMSWELIAIDDGSSDESAALVAELAERDQRVRLFRQPNLGVSLARNRGVAASHAPLIAFLDADDLWHQDKLRVHVAYHQANPGVGLSFSRVRFLSPDGLPTGVHSSIPLRPLQPVNLLSENPTTTTSNWVLRRELFEELGGFVTGMNYSEDLEWLLRMVCDGRWQIESINQVLTFYRTSVGGLSASLESMEQGWLRLIEEARHYAPALIDQHFASAQAVHLRYLARRSLRLRGDPTLGVDFLRRALWSDCRHLLRDPRRTLLTTLCVLSRFGLDRATNFICYHLLPILHLSSPASSSVHDPMPPHDAVVSANPKAPLVSVVIPLYNSAYTVRATIQSVLNQTYANLEILIVDDGSTDDGAAICRHFHDHRLRILHQENRGLAGARNTGIRASRGEFVAFLDSDDLWLPAKIEYHLNHLADNPKVGLSYSCSAFIDQDGRPLGIYQTPTLRGITPELILCRNPVSNGSCVVIRREVLDDIRFESNHYGYVESCWFDESFRQSEDVECWIRIALQTDWQIEGIPEALTLYRVTSGGLSANIDQQFASWQRVLDKTATYAPDVVARYGKRALAYQLRYLARRLIRERKPRQGLTHAHRAISTYPQQLLEEPLRTLITLVAGYSGVLLPPFLFRMLEITMMRITGVTQRLRRGIQAPQLSRPAADYQLDSSGLRRLSS